MDQVENRKNLIVLAIVTIIVIYISVSVFWVIRDMDTGQTVFVISSSLPQAGDTYRENTFLEKLKDLLKFPEKVPVPIEKKVTIKGRVIYTNGNPFAYGLVELRSKPRRTYTDGDGYFIFENVEEGDHTISVLSQSLEVLASCTVNINRNLEIKDVVLKQSADGTWVLEIAVDVKALQIVLEIEQNAAGQPSGKLLIHLDVKVPEYYPPEKDPDGSTDPDKPTDPDGSIDPDKPTDPDGSIDPDKPIDPDPSIPDQPEPPVTPPGSSGGSHGGGPKPQPSAGALTVYSTEDKTGDFSKPPVPAANINIFGNNKRIAPGMTGEYRFTVDNTANPFAIYYDIDFIETNNQLNIPMKYRLKNNKTNTYVTGDLKWHTIDEIGAVTANPRAPLNMNSSSKTNYTLEWLWEDGGILDNTYGKDHAGKVVCTLTIRVSAQRK